MRATQRTKEEHCYGSPELVQFLGQRCQQHLTEHDGHGKGRQKANNTKTHNARDVQHRQTEDTTQESPAQEPSLSSCYSLATYNLPRHLHGQRTTSRSVFGDVCTQAVMLAHIC